MGYIGGGPYYAETCPLCGETMWNGRCENPDCHYHWYPKEDDGNRQAVDRIAAECIGEMVTKFLDVAHGYDYTDLPFVVATMRTAANSIYMVLDDHRKSLADAIHNRTHCIGINMDELRKQMKEEEENETVDDKGAE